MSLYRFDQVTWSPSIFASRLGRATALLALAPAMGVLTITSAVAGRDPVWQAKSQDANPWLVSIHSTLNLTIDQQQKLDVIVAQSARDLGSLNSAFDLTDEERGRRFNAIKRTLYDQASPLLSDSQRARLRSLEKRFRLDGSVAKTSPLLPFVPLISVTYERFFPEEALTRSIFGPSPGSFEFGIRELVVSPTKRTLLSFGVDTFGIGNASSKLWEASTQASYEYRIPIQGELSAYSRISAGPAYMDYSMNTADGDHLAAKRLAGQGRLEVGFRFNRIQLSGSYRAFTQPAGINLNGFQADLTYVVVRF